MTDLLGAALAARDHAYAHYCVYSFLADLCDVV
jgi:hypothetical protein